MNPKIAAIVATATASLEKARVDFENAQNVERLESLKSSKTIRLAGTDGRAVDGVSLDESETQAVIELVEKMLLKKIGL